MKKLFYLCIIFIILFLQSACSTTENDLPTNAEYDKILFPLKIDGFYGFINIDGVLVVPPQFKEAYQSTCGIAVGVNDKGTFYLDYQGNILFSTKSTDAYARRFSDDLVAKCINTNQDDKRWGYVDKKGAWVIEPIYKIAGDFSEGLASVSYSNYDDRFYIDKSNTPVFEGKKYNGTKFQNGYAQVWQRNIEEIWVKREYGMERVSPSAGGFINKKGELVIPYVIKTLTVYSDGLLCFNYFDLDKILKEDKSYFGYMNIEQEVIIEPQYWLAYDFHEGLAVVSNDGINYGMINKKNEYVLSPEYKFLGEFSEGLIGFSKDGKNYGFMDRDGEIKIPAIFSFALSFDGSLAYINKDGIPGYVNKEGRYFLASDYD